MTDRVDINRLLVEMRSIKAQTQAFNRPDAMQGRDAVAPADRTGSHLVNDTKKVDNQSFGDLFTQAIDKVNETQKQSGALAKAYEQGDPNVDITDVMVAAQKSSVSFQAMVQVRNKLVEAYRDVMNMPI